MEQGWIEAGYFVVAPGASPKETRPLLPASILTVSTCIVDSYPDSWALPWVETSPEVLRTIQESLVLDDSAFADLRAWVASAMDEGRFGWPNVFLSVDAAREFKRRFLRTVTGVQVVGLGFSHDVAAAFLEDEALESSGVWTALGRNVELSGGGTPRGFDVLGAEYDGSFHTFSCNYLAEEFRDRFGVTFNRHGLIEEYSGAATASEYANSEESGAELVPWYPARLDGYED